MIEERIAQDSTKSSKAAAVKIPGGVSLADGLTEDEAVAIALWNNATFNADLTALGFARADIKEAGLLRNPILSVLFPIGPKQLEAAVNLPIEVLWQRPRRVAAAKANFQRVAKSLPQSSAQPQLQGTVPLARTPLQLGDVARIVEGYPSPIGDAIINDGPGLLLIVEKQPQGNTLEVTRNVEAALDQLRPGLDGLEIDSTIFRPATFIEMALENLNRALLIGCILVVAVLAAFLFEWRTALISMLAIPLSLITAALVLHYRGNTINTMVLAGLVLALGEVVDDAIIDVENIVRRLRLNREAGNPESSFQVVLKASLEVRSAIVYATLIVVLVFLPIFLLAGLAGTSRRC